MANPDDRKKDEPIIPTVKPRKATEHGACCEEDDEGSLAQRPEAI